MWRVSFSAESLQIHALIITDLKVYQLKKVDDATLRSLCPLPSTHISVPVKLFHHTWWTGATYLLYEYSRSVKLPVTHCYSLLTDWFRCNFPWEWHCCVNDTVPYLPLDFPSICLFTCLDLSSYVTLMHHFSLPSSL